MVDPNEYEEVDADFEVDDDEDEDGTGLVRADDEEAEEEEPGKYIETGLYRVLKSIKYSTQNGKRKDDRIHPGEIINFRWSHEEIEGSHEAALWGEEQVRFDLRNIAFADYFEGPLDADTLLAQEEEKARTELIDAQVAMNADARQLQGYNPHVLPSGQVAGTGLVRTDSVSPEAAKKGIKQRANEVEKTALRIENATCRLTRIIQTRAALLKADIEDQVHAIEQKMKGVKALLERAVEALWTISLYLGADEQIHCLREGVAAPQNEPIHIQQLVLYADEESAIVSQDGLGLNFQSFDVFNKWLLKSKRHVDQLCPFQKGIVAVKPRRKRDSDRTKDMNLWQTVEHEKENKRTYFLFRNGENLYWMTTKFDAGEHLVPTRDEFLSHFEGLTHVGDEQYMEALKKSSGLSMHWLRVGLIIQGIIDRTPIFEPLLHKPNILLAGDYGDGVRFVNDAETMLGRGLPPFADWLADVNSKLDVGCRIVGNFSKDRYDREEKKARYVNKHAGSGPKDDTLYEIESKRGGALVIMYDYKSWRSDTVRRAGYKLWTTDNFIINVDAVDADDCEAFLNDRNNRAEYEYMFPVLKAAIAAKHNEAKEERPFRRLLLDHTQASESEVDELIDWYKFKNKYHRPLKGDDAKAYRMITEEYPRYVKRKAQIAKLRDAGNEFAQWIHGELPNVMLVAHVEGTEFRVIQRADEREKVFVHESIWSVRGQTYGHKDDRRWTTLGNRWKRWNIIWKDDTQLKDWSLFPSVDHYLTHPEREKILNECMALLKKQHRTARVLCVRRTRRDKRWNSGHGDCFSDTEAVIWKPGKAVVPETALLSGKWVRPEVGTVDFYWSKGKTGIKTSISYTHDQWGRDVKPGPYAPWVVRLPDETKFGSASWGNNTVEVLSKDDDVIWAFEDELNAYIEWEKKAEPLSELNLRIRRNVIADAKLALERSILDKYIADHGDMELWDGYKKAHSDKFEINTREHELKDLKSALDKLLESGVNVEGMTVNTVIKTFQGFTEDEGEWSYLGDGSAKYVKPKIVTKRKNDTPASMLALVIRLGDEDDGAE